MAATDLLILPSDVVITPVKELSAEVRGQLTCEETDYAVSRPSSRTHTRIVDPDSVRLLEAFRKPKTIVEAVLEFSRARQIDPEPTLEKAFPVLWNLRTAGLLVLADSPDARPVEPAVPIGSTIAGCEVLRCLQVVEDTEVYQVQDPGGRTWALKTLRRGAHAMMADALRREARILKHLDGTCNPGLHAEGMHDGNAYLLLEWVGKLTALEAVGELRRPQVVDAAPKLLDLCCGIVDAYAKLHAQGVIHGDVHPRNVLVNDEGLIKLIDFGFARLERLSVPLPEHRGGVAFFFEPEYVQAARLGQQPPPASKLGEQYALGAMLYLLFAGAHYLDFSLEQEKMFRQIVEDSPLPFARRGLAPWPEVERVLVRALSKDPAQRFPSLEEMARSLSAARGSASGRSLASALSPSNAAPGSPEGDAADKNFGILDKLPSNAAPGFPEGAELLANTLRRLGTSSVLLASGLPSAPTASVNLGAAGVAYLFYRVACLRGDPQLLATADLWANRAKRESSRPEAFHSPEMDTPGVTVDPVSLYHMVSGVHCVQALISHSLGDFASAQAAVRDFITASRDRYRTLDLTIGRASTLIGCATLLEALSQAVPGDETALADLGKEVAHEIWSQLDTYAPVGECKELSFLGIAHGWAGLLYATLRWCQASRSAPPPGLEQRLDQLAEFAEPAGRGVRWRSRSEPDPHDQNAWAWVSWCNGSAGHVHLWTLAYQLLHEERFLRLAEKTAWYTWEASNPGSNTLCCGLTGQAYALLNLYKCVGEDAWLDRARQLGQRALADVDSPALHRHSLYKGDVGIALLAADLAQPASSCMPLFEAEGWPAENPGHS